MLCDCLQGGVDRSVPPAEAVKGINQLLSIAGNKLEERDGRFAEALFSILGEWRKAPSLDLRLQFLLQVRLPLSCSCIYCGHCPEELILRH